LNIKASLNPLPGQTVPKKIILKNHISPSWGLGKRGQGESGKPPNPPFKKFEIPEI
jgi:hypothetical protein